jgi:rare lipoprotein A (peptidoglycan hydrolase)
MTITARESTPLHMALAVNGTLASADAGSSVEIELMGVRTAWSWQPVAQTEVQSDGSYATTVKPKHPGQYAVRAVLGQAGAVAAATLPTITVIVYRPATATFYGPGFYGHRTACGKILRRSTVGVANRTLPCGTRVAVYYGGEMIVVPVIDRGPYANGANWDLTMATAKALAMYTTATIGAAPVPVHP